MSFKFPTASESKDASELKAIHIEVCAIQTAILDARCAGERSVSICDTPFTTSTEHWDAFQEFQGKCGTAGLTIDAKHLLSLQEQVVACFANLGYSILRVTNTITENTFCWEISW